MGQSGTASKTVAASSDANINGLLEGSAWDNVVNGMTVLHLERAHVLYLLQQLFNHYADRCFNRDVREDTNIRSSAE